MTRISACRPRIPINKQQGSYIAGKAIYETGPKTEQEVFSLGSFGLVPSRRLDALNRAFDTCWLRRTDDGLIDLTDFARNHYAEEAGDAPPAPCPKVAAPRQVNLMHRPPLRREYIPNTRGTRTDIPAWSIRPAPSFQTKA
jgi:hypothetical protein